MLYRHRALLEGALLSTKDPPCPALPLYTVKHVTSCVEGGSPGATSGGCRFRLVETEIPSDIPELALTAQALHMWVYKVWEQYLFLAANKNKSLLAVLAKFSKY